MLNTLLFKIKLNSLTFKNKVNYKSKLDLIVKFIFFKQDMGSYKIF